MGDGRRAARAPLLPPYVLVYRDVHGQIAESAPRILRLLAEGYHVLRQGSEGVWYERSTGLRQGSTGGGAP